MSLPLGDGLAAAILAHPERDRSVVAAAYMDAVWVAVDLGLIVIDEAPSGVSVRIGDPFAELETTRACPQEEQ